MPTRDMPATDSASAYGGTAYKAYVLFLLFLVYALTAADRSIILVLVEPIKQELGLSDSQVGILTGPAFAIMFTLCGIPLGVLADRRNRRNIIAACVAFWSLATGLTGMAFSFVQMALCRVGVGAGISGGTPGSMAIISDIFPAERRATALSCFYIGGAVGSVTAFGIGAWIAGHYGWRSAFLAFALPGFLLALLLWLTVREPQRGLSDGRAGHAAAVPVKETAAFMWRQRSVVHMLAGLILLHTIGNGAMTFFASFMIRSHGMTLAEAGGTISLLYLLTTPVSQLGAGLLADHLGRYDVRWRLRMGWIGSAVSLIGMCTMVMIDSRFAMAAFFACWAFGSGIYQSPIYALLQTVVKPQMRATMGSIQFVLTAAIGGAIGPLFVGVLSDRLNPQFGTDALRYALFILGLFYLWAAAHFRRGERSLADDLARAQRP